MVIEKTAVLKNGKTVKLTECLDKNCPTLKQGRNYIHHFHCPHCKVYAVNTSLYYNLTRAHYKNGVCKRTARKNKKTGGDDDAASSTSGSGSEEDDDDDVEEEEKKPQETSGESKGKQDKKNNSESSAEDKAEAQHNNGKTNNATSSSSSSDSEKEDNRHNKKRIRRPPSSSAISPPAAKRFRKRRRVSIIHDSSSSSESNSDKEVSGGQKQSKQLSPRNGVSEKKGSGRDDDSDGIASDRESKKLSNDSSSGDEPERTSAQEDINNRRKKYRRRTVTRTSPGDRQLAKAITVLDDIPALESLLNHENGTTIVVNGETQVMDVSTVGKKPVLFTFSKYLKFLPVKGWKCYDDDMDCFVWLITKPLQDIELLKQAHRNSTSSPTNLGVSASAAPVTAHVDNLVPLVITCVKLDSQLFQNHEHKIKCMDMTAAANATSTLEGYPWIPYILDTATAAAQIQAIAMNLSTDWVSFVKAMFIQSLDIFDNAIIEFITITDVSTCKHPLFTKFLFDASNTAANIIEILRDECTNLFLLTFPNYYLNYPVFIGGMYKLNPRFVVGVLTTISINCS